MNKTAKRVSDALSAHRAASEAAEAESVGPEADARRALLATMRASRGPSLMDAHVSKRAKPSMSSSSASASASGSMDGERMAFDRERDMPGRRAVGASQMERMVAAAKNIDERFSKGHVQGSSL